MLPLWFQNVQGEKLDANVEVMVTSEEGKDGEGGYEMAERVLLGRDFWGKDGVRVEWAEVEADACEGLVLAGRKVLFE